MGDKTLDYWAKQMLKTLPFISISTLILIPIGIAFLCISDVENKNIKIIDYTNCELFSFESSDSDTCLESLLKKETNKCICYYYFNITEKLEGDIIIYYELESFDQLGSNYVNSRDDKQLMGILDEDPSEKCEPYRYEVTAEGKKPIVPCGAIANGFFNDTYKLRYVTNNTKLPLVYSGIISDDDKAGYHNPDNLKNLTTEELNKFANPKNWNSSIWELDYQDPNNNGFQNERFIGWMKTEWTRKPLARVNKSEPLFENGLPTGSYELRVDYTRINDVMLRPYVGRRLLIFTASQTMRTSLYIIGIIALVVGLILLIAVIVTVFLNKETGILFRTSNLATNDTHASENHREQLNGAAVEEKPMMTNDS